METEKKLDATEIDQIIKSSDEPSGTEIDQIIKSSDEPSGVVVHATDGRIFFLTNEEARRTAIPASKLYSAFASIKPPAKHPPVAEPQVRGCDNIWNWLESHSPNSARWRRLCLIYFFNC